MERGGHQRQGPRLRCLSCNWNYLLPIKVCLYLLLSKRRVKYQFNLSLVQQRRLQESLAPGIVKMSDRAKPEKDSAHHDQFVL